MYFQFIVPYNKHRLGGGRGDPSVVCLTIKLKNLSLVLSICAKHWAWWSLFIILVLRVEISRPLGFSG